MLIFLGNDAVCFLTAFDGPGTDKAWQATTEKRQTNNKKQNYQYPPSVCYIIPFCITCDGHESHRNNLKNDCMDSDVHVKEQKQQI